MKEIKMKNKFQRVNRRKYLFIISILLMILLTYIFVIYSNYSSNRDLLLDTVRQNQIQLVKAYKRKIDEKLNSKKRVIQATALYISKKDRILDYSLIKDILALSIKNGDFRSVYIGYYDDYFITGISWVAPKWYKATKRQWYKDVKKNKKIIVTPPYKDSDLEGNVISIASPIYKNNKLYAVLSSDIKINTFKRDILSLMPVKDGFAFMMSKEGDIILKAKEFGFKIKETVLKKLSKSFLHKKSGVKTFMIDGNNYIFTFDSLKNSNWIFISVLDEKKIYKKLNDKLFINSIITLSLVFLGLLSFLYISWTQKRLYNSRHLLELFAKSSSWGVLMTNEIGSIVFVNKFYERIFSFRNKEIYSKSIYNISHLINNKNIFPKDKDYFEELKNDPNKIISFKIQNEDIVYDMQIKPLLRANKYFEGFLIIITDISKEAFLEKKESIQEKIYIQNSKMVALGEMISAISHQWRQPLSILLLLISNLEEMINKSKMPLAHEYLLRSRANIELMNETIETFRNFYKEDISKNNFDIVNVFNEINLIIMPSLQINGIKLQFNYDKNISYEIYSYGSYLKQVLLNLIDNSKDALKSSLKKDSSKDASIDIYLEKQNNTYIIRIEDNAEGINYLQKDKIFQALYTTKGKEGTGLGLHLCKLLIEDKMEGRLFLQKCKNPTSFIIELRREFDKSN